MCQRLVCQKREFIVRSSSCEVYDPKLWHIFWNRHEAFILLKIFVSFSVVVTVVVCQKLIHVYAHILVV